MQYMLKDERAIRIYETLSVAAVGRVPLMTAGSFRETDCRNLFRFLITREGRPLLRYLDEDEFGSSSENSDYEKFLRLCDSIQDLSGSAYYSDVRLAMELLLPGGSVLSSQDAEHLWSSAIPKLKELTEEALSKPFSVVSLPDATQFLFPSMDALRQCETFDCYADLYRASLGSTPAVMLRLPCVKRFCAPNPYRVGEGYLSLRNAASPSECDLLTEEATFVSSQLIRLTGEYCKERNIPMLLCGSCDPKLLRDIISYLKRQDRLPRLILSVNNREELADFEHSGALSLAEGVVPAFDRLSVSNTELRTVFESICCAYPIGKILFLPVSGIPGTPGTALEARILWERILRTVADVFSDWINNGDLEDEAAAIRLGQKILFDTANSVFC